jgi:nucleoside-diphosphate-sugar epimerase
LPARVAVTGASGYLGSAIAAQLRGAGHSVLALTRRPALDYDWRFFDLADPPAPELLSGVDVLVHCAYDLRLTAWPDIVRVNVDGTRRLLHLAAASDVRCQLVSSMSAYEGTDQLYGRAKLACEAEVLRIGGNAVRPGLVYGGEAGGMVATLAGLTRLPVIPVFGARSHQFTVHVDDAVLAVQRLVDNPQIGATVAGLAHPSAIRFDDLLRRLAAGAGNNPRLVPIPWFPVYLAMRLAEIAGLTLPVRADSVLGLAHPAPVVPNVELWRTLAVELRPLPVA